MMGAIVSKDERIDLTQLEESIETANAYMESWFKGTVTPMNGKEWRDIRDLGLHVDWSHNEVFGPLVEEFPTLIAELKRMYELEDKLRTVITTLDFEYGIAAKLLGEVEPASE
tara:strand:- start:3622 stop:3960 length:339 start_codon:yes stop_codon:yes gene_type:complete